MFLQTHLLTSHSQVFARSLICVFLSLDPFTYLKKKGKNSLIET